jgi:hypothetical protein
MNVPFRRREIAVAGKMSEYVRVHVRSPTGRARMSERVKREARDLGESMSSVECGFFNDDFSICPDFVGAGKTQSDVARALRVSITPAAFR